MGFAVFRGNSDEGIFRIPNFPRYVQNYNPTRLLVLFANLIPAGGPDTGPTPGSLTIVLARSLPTTPNPAPAPVVGRW